MEIFVGVWFWEVRVFLIAFVVGLGFGLSEFWVFEGRVFELWMESCGIFSS